MTFFAWSNLAAAVALVGLACHASAAFVVDTHAVGREFTGVGAISGGGATSRLLVSYPEPLRSQLLDMMFTPGQGINLQILKVEIGGDAQSTDGSEPSHMHTKDDLNYQRGYEWWLMSEAKARNPNIQLYGLPWAFPAWVGAGTTSPYSQPSVTASYVVKWLQGAKSVYDLDIDYIGIWNEREFNSTYIKVLRQAMDSAGFTTTRIVAPDGWDVDALATDMLNDKALMDAVYAIGFHYPGTASTPLTLQTGKPLWASEDMSTHNDLRGAGCWVRILNANYVNGNLTTTISWNLAASYYHGLPWYGTGLFTATEPWSGNWETDNRNLGLIYGTAHTTYFAEPGWKYLKHGAGSGWLSLGGSYVTLTDGTELTLIVEKMAWDHSVCIRPSTPQFQTENETAVFQLPLTFAGKTLHLWSSQFGWDGMQQVNSTFMQHSTVVVSSDAKVTLDVRVDGVYTITTLNKPPLAPLPTSAPSKPFPTSYKVSSEARYFADQAGSWQIEATPGSEGNKVMRQNVPQRPICWSGDYSPYTIIGDSKWTSVSVSADVFIESSTGGMAFVAARLGVCCMPQGVFFGVDATRQRWVLFTNITGSGLAQELTWAISNETWYTLRLDISDDNTAAAWINGAQVTSGVSLPRTVPRSGWVGFGTGVVPPYVAQLPHQYVLAQFDNFTLSGAVLQTCPRVTTTAQLSTHAQGDAVASSTPVPLAMAWCGEPTSANTEWVFTMVSDTGTTRTTGAAVLGASATVSLRSAPGLCLDAHATSSGGLGLAPCSGAASQVAVLTPSTTEPWVGILVGDSALQIDNVVGAPLTTTVAGVGTTTCASSDLQALQQAFKFTGGVHGDQFGQLSNGDGMCLDGGCGDLSKGCYPMKLVPCTSGTTSQQFIYTDEKYFVNTANGGCLDLWAGEGPQVGMFTCHNGTNQQWAVKDGSLMSAVPMPSGLRRCVMGRCPLAGGSQFMVDEFGRGQLSLYGRYVTDHCVAAGCPITPPVPSE